MFKRIIFTLSFFCYACQLNAGTLGLKNINSNKLDIVFCLDLSGSTNGLINDVREGLWHIVNQVNLLEPRPQFRIGVVGFSRPSFKTDNSYVKILSELTDDFDLISHELYKLKPAVEKGDQYVGVAINTCITRLNWDDDKSTRKIIYIVGNGMVGTNNNDYIKACQLAVQRNIIVNPVYVMGKSDKARELPGWYRIATLANGIATEIAVGSKELPYNKNIDFNNLIDESRDLNLTYIYHGEKGYDHYQNFREADSTSFAAGKPVFIERALFKNSQLFKWANARWDMVDHLRLQGSVPPINDTLQIPDSLRSMNPENIYDLLQEQKSIRQRAINNIEYIFKEDYSLQVHRQYFSGELKEENSFARSVIIILQREWK